MKIIDASGSPMPPVSKASHRRVVKASRNCEQVHASKGASPNSASRLCYSTDMVLARDKRQIARADGFRRPTTLCGARGSSQTHILVVP